MSWGIYDITGKEVQTMVDGFQDEGYKTVQWDGTNNQGKIVSAGMYFYVVDAHGSRIVKKMIFLK